MTLTLELSYPNHPCMIYLPTNSASKWFSIQYDMLPGSTISCIQLRTPSCKSGPHNRKFRGQYNQQKSNMIGPTPGAINSPSPIMIPPLLEVLWCWCWIVVDGQSPRCCESAGGNWGDTDAPGQYANHQILPRTSGPGAAVEIPYTCYFDGARMLTISV
jgi:hypothetical protein